MSQDFDFEDDDSIRIARRQWMDPEKKEKVMGAVKKMVMDYDFMTLTELINNLCYHNLIGFGEASFMDLENYLGYPLIHPDQFHGGGVAIFDHNKPWSARCAWGIEWGDGNCIMIHDRDSQVEEIEDIKHWHITGTREGWHRLKAGYPIDTMCLRLEAVAVV